MTTEQSDGACTPSFSSAELERFEVWWAKHGQFCRAGGGEYEKTFAFRAWEAATNEEREACAKVCAAMQNQIMTGGEAGAYWKRLATPQDCADRIMAR